MFLPMKNSLAWFAGDSSGSFLCPYECLAAEITPELTSLKPL